MKTVWFVINKNPKLLLAPYVKQYLAFEKDEDMLAYLKKEGWGQGSFPTIASICKDVGMVNFFRCGDVDLTVMRMEVK